MGRDTHVEGLGLSSPPSFAEFYEAEYPAVVRLAAALTGRWEVAEELAQDAFLAAHGRWAKVSTYDSPASWIRRVVTNRAVSVIRRRTVEARLLLRLGGQRQPTPHVGEPAAGVWKAVAALPKRQAQVIALVFLEDRSLRDVAEILGCGDETARTHLRRGLASLATRFELDREKS